MIISTEQIHLTYQAKTGAVHALNDVSFSMQSGEIAVVSGPSGSGKSTLLMAMGGLLRPDSGRVLFKGTDIYQLPPPERAAFRNRRIGFVFQQFHLIPYLSVTENITAPSLAGGTAAPDPGELIRRFKLESRADHLPSQLSTGERQRTALARALYNNPDLILADEPTGNLDEINGRIVVEHLKSIADEGRAVLVVSHDPRLHAHGFRMLTMAEGRLTEK